MDGHCLLQSSLGVEKKERKKKGKKERTKERKKERKKDGIANLDDEAKIRKTSVTLISTTRRIDKRPFFVGNFINTGQLRSIIVN